MKVLIEIDEEVYEHIRESSGLAYAVEEHLHEVEWAIKNGTPLPKGHGDLKDQNELLTVLIKSAEAHCQNSREDALMGRVRQQILGCHAIIEAESEDKE